MIETVSATRMDLSAILDEPVDWRFKGFPPVDPAPTIGTIGERGWNALTGDLLFPLLLIKERALAHNIALMERFCREHGVSYCPHGKTPMAPQIVKRQLDADAWGITAATIAEARVFRRFGVPRILLASELVEPAGIRWAARELEADPDFEFICLVDSVAGVDILTRTLQSTGASRPWKVLIEMGAPVARAGCRTPAEALTVARAVKASPVLELAGVEGYEGAIPGATFDERLQKVDVFLASMHEFVDQACREGLFDHVEEIIASAGGSLFFDRVIEHLGGSWSLSVPVRTLIRPGTYVTHDADTYERFSPLAGRGAGPDRLQVALELWSIVLSCPEPGRAVAGFGRRDTSFDVALPKPFALLRNGEMRTIAGEVTVTQLNDQHAYLVVEEGFDLAVGDVLGCAISHPCTAFQCWKLLPLVDEDYQVTGAIRTFF